MKKIALGRGLEALIGGEVKGAEKSVEVVMVDISKISKSNYQPRHRFDSQALDELKNSIKEKGVIQPVLLRKTGEKYQLIAGERRVKAAQALGMETIPALIKDIDEGRDVLEISLVENIQREDLNPLEKARSYQRLMTEFGLTHDQIAGKVSKDRTSVSNTIRILELEEEIKSLIEEGKLSFGHARALLTFSPGKKRVEIAQKLAESGASVREIERIATSGKIAKRRTKAIREKDLHLLEMEKKLRDALKTKVTISQLKGRKGRIEIEYFSIDEFERIAEIILK